MCPVEAWCASQIVPRLSGIDVQRLSGAAVAPPAAAAAAIIQPGQLGTLSQTIDQLLHIDQRGTFSNGVEVDLTRAHVQLH